MKLVVTGGRGFIGSHFIELAIANNDYVFDYDYMSYCSNYSLPFDNHPNYKHPYLNIDNYREKNITETGNQHNHNNNHNHLKKPHNRRNGIRLSRENNNANYKYLPDYMIMEIKR